MSCSWGARSLRNLHLCRHQSCTRARRDDEFNEIFARLGSHRDRALVAFYVSTGARASELLSASQGGVDPGRQLIAVVRKGSREIQELPASTDAFVWLRLCQVEMAQEIPARGPPGSPIVRSGPSRLGGLEWPSDLR